MGEGVMTKPDALEKLREKMEQGMAIGSNPKTIIILCAEVLEEAAKRANTYSAEEALRKQATRFRSVVEGER